jgi:hypothetical protein
MKGLSSTAMVVALLSLASATASVGDTVQVPTSSQVSADVASTRNASTLRSRGEQLRKELNFVYKHLHEHSREIPNHAETRNISETVIKFLPIGISVNDAESILRFAGFKIQDLPEDGSSPTLAIAIIYPFEKHFLYTYYSSIKIVLSQGAMDRRDTVGSVFATVMMPES